MPTRGRLNMDHLKNNNPSLILQRQGQVQPFTLLKHFSDTTNPSRRGSHHNNNTGAGRRGSRPQPSCPTPLSSLSMHHLWSLQHAVPTPSPPTHSPSPASHDLPPLPEPKEKMPSRGDPTKDNDVYECRTKSPCLNSR